MIITEDEKAAQCANSLDTNTQAIPSLLVRALAWLIDCSLIFMGVLWVNSVAPIFAGVEDPKAAYKGLFILGWFLLIVYESFSIHLCGKTVGCLLLGLKVISVKDKKVSFMRAFGRGIGLATFTLALFPVFLLIHLIHMWRSKDPHKRALWDIGPKTVVIKSWY